MDGRRTSREEDLMEYIENLKGIKKEDLKTFTLKVLKDLPDANKLLVLFPDYTRLDFTKDIIPLILKRYISSTIHFLNAGGTHRPMTDDEFKNNGVIS